jgi:predicted lipid-binding transport protein (Tim44 family)
MKGRPFLGVFSGFFFGLFGGLTLFLFGVVPLDSHLLWILPIVGIVLGLIMAAWAPFGKATTVQPAQAQAQASPTAQPAQPAQPAPEASPTPDDTLDDTVVDADPPVQPDTESQGTTDQPPVQ